MIFKGNMVALVTPMHPDGSIDYGSFSDLIEWHIACKTTALIIAGTTGEGATLTAQEQSSLLTRAIQQSAKRVPIIAGTGTYSTHHTIELTLQAKAVGADAALIVTPYYNKPSQAGLYQHYKAIAEQARLPIILYNVPGRTACDLLPDTIEALAKFPEIIGIKEATGKLERCREILQRCPSLAVYSGDDLTACSLLLHGAHGIISVSANVFPEHLRAFCEAALKRDSSLAEKWNTELMPLHKMLFVETNPIPVKWALHALGRIPSGIRLPLTPLDQKYHGPLRDIVSGLEKI